MNKLFVNSVILIKAAAKQPISAPIIRTIGSSFSELAGIAGNVNAIPSPKMARVSVAEQGSYS